ncbi:MAG: hypothetical protein ACETWM_19760 [Candidatus Lokiarchaeia archaeon]
MAKAYMLTGMAGGIIGSITGIIGLIWCLISITSAIDIYNYIQMLFVNSQMVGILALVFFPYPSSIYLFTTFSFILATLLLVSLILVGLGFYGTYRAGAGAMGVVGLIFGIIGGVAGPLFIFLGNIMTGIELVPLFVAPILDPWAGLLLFPLSVPNYGFIWLGMMVLTITFILLGSSSIAVREMTNSPSATLAAGILSIIGSCFLILYLLVQNSVPILVIIGGILTLVGFILIFVAFILWSVVFFTSRDI